jgi:hypothetical protein
MHYSRVISREMGTEPSLSDLRVTLGPVLPGSAISQPSSHQIQAEEATPAQTVKREESESLPPVPDIEPASSQPLPEDESVRLNLTDLFVGKTPE